MDKRPKNKKGNIVKWEREDLFISGPSVFHNDASKVAQAFGEHLSPGQLTELVLKTTSNLIHGDRLISQAASMLLRSFLEECGTDVEDLPLTVQEIYSRLPIIRDAFAKQEAKRAICSLACRRVGGVVDCLLEVSVGCDGNAKEVWKALVSDPYSNTRLLRPLLKRLQGEDPRSENSGRRNSKSLLPLPATNALRWILTLPNAAEVVQGKFPHLPIALVTQISYSLGSSRKGSRRSNYSEASEPSGVVRMSSVSRKDKLLKRRSLENDANTSGEKTDHRQSRSLPHQARSQEPAGRRNAEHLPPLTKPAASSEDQKPTPTPPLMLPLLPQRRLPKTTAGTSQADTTKEATPWPKLPVTAVRNSTTATAGSRRASQALGISAALPGPLREILMVLRDDGNQMQARRSLTLEKKTLEDLQGRVPIQDCIAWIECYGHAAAGANTEDLLLLIEFLISELLRQFRAGYKNQPLKTAFLKSINLISRALQGSRRQDCPHKSELLQCIIEMIEEEPQESVCFPILHLALTTIGSLTLLKPVLDCEVRSNLVSKTIKKVYSLPALKMTKLKAGSSTYPTQTQDFYEQTMSACNSVLTSLLSEVPNMDGLQEILIHTNGWMESEMPHERERAVRSTSHVLKFAAEHLDFDVSQEFSLLGQLVAVLGMRTMDSVKEIGLQAAQAMYHLHHLTMSQMVKEMDKRPKNKKGNIVKWEREDLFISGPSVFHNDASKVAQAFGEHLSPGQLTELVLKTTSNLIHGDRLISQAASMLLRSFLEECGTDVEDLPLTVREIYSRLPNIRDAFTKQEAKRAICSLACRRVGGVVDCLLEVSVGCDGNAKEVWKALVSDPYSNTRLLRPLLKRLQGEDPRSENSGRRNSKSLLPLAATNALRWILTLPNAAEVVREKFPHLLIALVTQISYSLGSSRKGSRRSNYSEASEPSGVVSSGVQALKNLIACMGFCRVYNILTIQGTWDKLQQPGTFFEGVFELVRELFKFTKAHMVMTFKLANAYLYHHELKERTVGMAFFTELLFHRDIGLRFVKQDILDVLRGWMAQPCPQMQLFGIRGLGHLLQHNLEDESLEALLTPLTTSAVSMDKGIVKETIKTLQSVFDRIEMKKYTSLCVQLIQTMLQYFHDEDDELRRISKELVETLMNGVAVSDGN
ncbi:maestro heat-like repeat-containing protein family member 7 isoform X2 [Paroedura picta]